MFYNSSWGKKDEEISLLSLADRLGRGNLCQEKVKKEEKRINDFKSFFADKYK